MVMMKVARFFRIKRLTFRLSKRNALGIREFLSNPAQFQWDSDTLNQKVQAVSQPGVPHFFNMSADSSPLSDF
jgi:hypothetical protein